MLHSLFGFTGRIARLRYFGLSLLTALVLGGLYLVIVTGLASTGVSDATLEAYAVLVMLALAVPAQWPVVALGIKRLHDLGLPGWHILWVLILGWAPQFVPQGTTLAMLAGLPALGVGLWLLFTPGQDHPNAYGLPPDEVPLSQGHPDTLR